AHLFFDEQVAERIEALNFVHHFIYRDPRDVALSEAHYYRSINRWHRLHPRFRDAPSIADAVAMAIEGVNDPTGRIYYPDIGTRFRHYEPWIRSPHVFAVRFEDLVSDRRSAVLEAMVEFYLGRAPAAGDAAELCRRAAASIAPEKSHTFRKGKQGGWRETFAPEHRAAFKRHAGSILIEHGYEADDRW
ncbi:MAG: hypothetical protein DCC67_17415, partial [Planctomycetota bacterium]